MIKMEWKDQEIKSLKEHITFNEEWLEGRAEFTKKIREWMVQDRARLEELQEQQKQDT